VRHLNSYTIVLLRDAFGDKSTIRAVVKGPYRNKLPLNSYSTVLLFATGIGIVGQLPYIT
jgi:NAD(P)H-flavin reductase